MVYMAVGFFTAGGNSDELKLSFWGTNLPYQYALEEAALRYNNIQSKYKVVISKEDAGNYRTWMSSQLAGGTASDILATTSIYADADAQNGYMYDFSQELNLPNPYNLEAKTLWKEDFAGSYLQILEDKNVSGRWNCIPTSTVSVRFMINTDMLRANGISIPDQNWTFSDFRKICEIFESKGVTAIEIANAKFINYMVSWLLDVFLGQVMYDEISEWDVNLSGQIETEEIVKILLDKNVNNLNFKQNNDFKSVLTFLKQWSAHWGSGFNSRSDTSESFLRQQTPMFFSGSWGVAGVELTLGNDNPEADPTNPYDMFNYISLPVPRLEKVNYISAGESFEFPNLKENLPLQELGEPSGCFAIPSSTVKNGKLEGALDFLQFLTSPQIASVMADIAYEIPVIKGVNINEKMSDFLPPENSQTLKMRFNLLNLADGTAEEYHFKQMQLYLMNGTGSISQDTFCNNIQLRYLSVANQLAIDNEWNW